MVMKASVVIILILTLHITQSANILGIFPTPSISHQVVFRALMKDLAARGHHLTILTTDPYETDNPNVTQIDCHSSYEFFRKELDFIKIKNSRMDQADQADTFFRIMMKNFEDQTNHPDVKRLIKERHKYHFDVVIIEVLRNHPMLAFGELFDAPVIEFVSLDTFNENHAQMGNEANSVVHPEWTFPFLNQGRLSIIERLKILKYLWKFNKMSFYHDKEFVRLIKQHFPIPDPNMDKLRDRIELLMTNTHPALGYLRPILPNTVQLGFMHIEPAKPLEVGPLKDFLDNSEHGVIYMSFGSNVQARDLSQEIKKIFLDVFGSLKYDVLWKFENDTLPNRPENLMIEKWLPQADLLAHPKIKLFITQGGQQSMEEAIDREIPTIVIPFLFDQFGNAIRMEQRKVGKYLQLTSLTKEKLEAAIEEMMKPEYKKNIRKLKEIVYDQPMSSREKAVWWTEYVIRHKGAKHFKYYGKDTPFFEKYFLDIGLIGIISLGIVIKLGTIITSKIFVSKKKKIE